MVEQVTARVMLADLPAMNGTWAEVVDGHIMRRRGDTVPMAYGFLHNQVMGNIYALLREYAHNMGNGYACTGGMEYVLQHNDDGAVVRSRLPDASFIRKDSLPTDYNWTQPFIGAPDLAVEVVSPSNSASDMLERVEDYLQAGTSEVWVVYPVREELYQYRKDAPTTVQIYRHETPIVSTVLPDLSLNVDQLLDV